MSDLFASLVDRALGRAPVLPLRLPGVFEAAPAWEEPVGDGLDADEERAVAVPSVVTADVPGPEPASPRLRDRLPSSPAEPATPRPETPAPPVVDLPQPPGPTASPRPPAEPAPAPAALHEQIVALVASALDRPPPPGALPVPAAAAPAAGDEPTGARPDSAPAPTPPPPVILRVPEASPRSEAVGPTVEVHIGRIEVKAAPAPAPAPRPRPGARPTTGRRASVPLPLQDYLRARGRR